MSLSRLRAGESLALAGSIALFFLLFADWAAPSDKLIRSAPRELPGTMNSLADKVVGGYVNRFAESGWTTLGWFMVAMLVVVMAGGVALAVLTVIERESPVLCVVAAVLTSAMGIITSVVLLIRLTLAQPALQFGFPDSAVDIKGAAWLGLLALVLITAGAWITMGDERTEAATSAVGDIPVRPAPPAAA